MLLDDGKRENIEWARKKYLKATSANTSNTIFNEAAASETETKQKSNLVSRGIQTMLRLSSQNHLHLSDMADGKANILISVNSIIISVILSVLLRKLEVDAYLTIPTIIFLVFSVSTIVLAILATRPKISEGRFSKNDIVGKRTNLLFFGNFYKSSLDEYKWAMSTMMQDKDYLYGSLIQDIHQLGKVLGRKYKLIRAAYNVFMIGIIVSVIAFGIAVAFHSPQDTTVIYTPSTSPL